MSERVIVRREIPRAVVVRAPGPQGPPGVSGSGGGGAVDSVDGRTGAVTLADLYQPLDSDLSAIAALATTAFGRSFLALADAAAGRTLLALGTAATAATGDFDAAGAAAAAQAASQPLDSDLTAIAALVTTAFGRALLALADAGSLRTAAGLGTIATHPTTDFIAATEKGAASGVATLDGSGLVPTAQLPPLAINEVFVVGSQAAMLALTAQRGDAARRTDTTPNKLFLLTTDDPTVLANWLDISVTDAVSSVEGRFGAVTLGDLYQPLDGDLTALAALTTTTFGRSVLEAANAAALRTLAGLGTSATQDKVAAGAAGVLDATDATTTNTRTPTDNTVSTAKVVDDAVTFAKVQNIATARLLGRNTAGAGDIEELSAATAKALLGIIASDLSDFAEATDDRVAALLTAGTGVSLPYNDGAGTITVKVDRVVEILVTDPNGAALTTGDGKAYFTVPAALNGFDLVLAHAALTTVSSSGLPTVQIANVTDGVDMLSTKVTIDASELSSHTAATPPVIDATKDDVATGDLLRVDVDVAGTGAKGLMVLLTFRQP